MASSTLEAETSPATSAHADEVWSCRLPKRMTREERANILASVSRENPVAFHETSQYPITKEIEDKLEQMSLAVTKEEYGNEFWKDGVYMCSKCHQQLYVSSAKFKGPCLWPSFREPVNPSALIKRSVDSYNNYDCAVFEVYCSCCRLFLGHMFEDGATNGDTHPSARWRHCVLSLSLTFMS
eukprot:gene1142-4361_t